MLNQYLLFDRFESFRYSFGVFRNHQENFLQVEEGPQECSDILTVSLLKTLNFILRSWARNLHLKKVFLLVASDSTIRPLNSNILYLQLYLQKSLLKILHRSLFARFSFLMKISHQNPFRAGCSLSIVHCLKIALASLNASGTWRLAVIFGWSSRTCWNFFSRRNSFVTIKWESECKREWKRVRKWEKQSNASINKIKQILANLIPVSDLKQSFNRRQSA